MITQLMGEEKSISARKVSQFSYLASSFEFAIPSRARHCGVPLHCLLLLFGHVGVPLRPAPLAWARNLGVSNEQPRQLFYHFEWRWIFNFVQLLIFHRMWQICVTKKKNKPVLIKIVTEKKIACNHATSFLMVCPFGYENSISRTY